MGVHWLGIETGRHVHTTRSDRLCTCCDLHAREDEVHLLLCPFYEGVRSKYPHFFHNIDVMLGMRSPGVYDEMMLSVMNPTDTTYDAKRYWHDFAHFLLECKSIRQVRLSMD